MKKCVLIFTLVLAMSVGAFAADWYNGIYVAPKFTFAYADMDVKANGAKSGEDDTVFGGGLAAGYDFYKRFNLPLRTELEYSFLSEAETDFNKNGVSSDQKLKSQTLFLNAFYDFHNRTRFTPYVGAGVGVAFLKEKGQINGTSVGSDDTTNFAWNGTVGVGFKIIENLSADLGYRFVGLGDAESKDSATGKVKSEDIYMHQATLSVRYTF